jgi:hypothetical protein
VPQVKKFVPPGEKNRATRFWCSTYSAQGKIIHCKRKMKRIVRDQKRDSGVAVVMCQSVLLLLFSSLLCLLPTPILFLKNEGVV